MFFTITSFSFMSSGSIIICSCIGSISFINSILGYKIVNMIGSGSFLTFIIGVLIGYTIGSSTDFKIMGYITGCGTYIMGSASFLTFIIGTLIGYTIGSSIG